MVSSKKEKVESIISKQESSKKSQIKMNDYDTSELRVIVPDEEELMQLEFEYFEKVSLEYTKVFGGSQGKLKGGVTSFCVSNNGRFIAQALDNGTLLVIDVDKDYEITRIFEGPKQTKYVYVEISSDNCS